MSNANGTLIRDEPEYDWTPYDEGFLYGVEQIDSDPFVAVSKGIDYMMGWNAAWGEKYKIAHRDDQLTFGGEPA